MRPSNKSRSRNKPGGNNGSYSGNSSNNNQRRSMGNIINRVFESAGPDGKVRGTPQQIIDKYQALARDAQLAGDRVAAESYLQHSEHYSRLLGEAQRQQVESNRTSQERDDGQPRGQDRDDGQPRAQERDDAHSRNDDGFDQQRRQPSMAAPIASGLAMIEPDDSYDLAGPVETPEGRRSPVVQFTAPLPENQPERPAEPRPEEQVNGNGFAPEPEAAEPVKRSRPRRRQKADAPVAEAASQPE
jgi:Domain of unknown function (DUF4167)